jgi:hypothetical protein
MTEQAPDGYYDATITQAHWESDPQDDNGLVLAFEVKLDDGGFETCLQRTSGTARGARGPVVFAEIAQAVLEELGLPWPEGIERIEETIGKDVRVQIKSKTAGNSTFRNVYIMTKRVRERVGVGAAKAAVQRIKGEPYTGNPDDIPF